MTENFLKILYSVRNAFRLKGSIAQADALGSGGIHRTYRIRMHTGEEYIFQQMNTAVFRSPDAVMQNIARVTAYLNRNFPDKKTLHFYQTETGEYLFQNWRVMDAIRGESKKSCENLEQIHQAGKSFGNFQKAVSGLNAENLFPVLPEFHNTGIYFQKFQILDSHLPEAEILRNWQEQACYVSDYYQKNRLPLIVTHNDMKCSNLLFDRITGQPLAVIDLDTVMPGMAVYDFGDAVRSFASNTSSSEQDLSRVGLNMQKFQAFASGWLSQKEYLPEERKLLIPAVFSVTAELAVRYLTDYLQGNVYFKTDFPEQNLIRARNQIRLAQDILNHEAEMEKILNIFITGGFLL